MEPLNAGFFAYEDSLGRPLIIVLPSLVVPTKDVSGSERGLGESMSVG